jgi:large subunit ribosomal protein L31
MKKDVHPTNYRVVVFEDLNNNARFMTRSTVVTDETVKIEGVDYPLVKVHISAASHPFFTGQEKLVDIEGRVDKFEKRRLAAEAAKKAKAEKAALPAKAEKEEKEAPAKIGNLKTAR